MQKIGNIPIGKMSVVPFAFPDRIEKELAVIAIFEYISHMISGERLVIIYAYFNKKSKKLLIFRSLLSERISDTITRVFPIRVN
jgi:hypothetical protein